MGTVQEAPEAPILEDQQSAEGPQPSPQAEATAAAQQLPVAEFAGTPAPPDSAIVPRAAAPSVDISDAERGASKEGTAEGAGGFNVLCNPLFSARQMH